MFPSKLLVRVPRTIYGIALLLELDKTVAEDPTHFGLRDF